MVFSSMIFLWVFLPVVLILGLLIRKQPYQNIILLLASLFFYAWGEPIYIILLVITIFFNWFFGLCMEKHENGKKVFLILAIVCDLGLLGFFKYFNFAMELLGGIVPSGILPHSELVLPIGISFYTFQAMSYVIDLYRGEYPAQKNFLNLALYISFFPQLIAGPIVRYIDIEKQLVNRVITSDKIASGIRRFLYGVGKKVVIANTLAVSGDQLFDLLPHQMSAGAAWVAAIFYTLQIYYDFSGYSDMAIGLGRIFGFEFPENFKYPYLSTSISEFWRRWHITLGTWFREYLYIPLGGNRKGNARTYLNLFIVFAVTGLWHGANMTFVVWGLYHGFFMIIERLGFSKVLKKCKPLAHVYAVLVFVIGWVLFRAKDLHTGLTIIKRMVLPWKYTVSSHVMTMLSVQSILALIFGIIGCGILQRLCETKAGAAVAAKWKNSVAEMVFLFVILFYSMILLASGAYNPFIYFQF